MCARKLYGRNKEVALLRKAFLPSVGAPNQVVLVEGRSGAGKSALIEQALAGLTQSTPLVGAGKFDANFNAPLGVIIRVLTFIIEELIQSDPNRLSEIHGALGHEECDTIARVIPQFALAAADNTYSAQCPSPTRSVVGVRPRVENPLNKETSKDDAEKLKHALHRLLSIVASPTTPLILVFDDIQWSDSDSLKLLRSLVVSSMIQNLVLVFAYRDDELVGNDVLNGWIKRLKNNPSTLLLTIGGLDIESISSLLKDTLQVDVVDELAGVLHSRTDGNVFYMLQLLDYLREALLIKYSSSLEQYEWDLDSVRLCTNISDNVVGIIVSRINRQPKHFLDILKRIGLFGVEFDQDVVHACSTVFPYPQNQIRDALNEFCTAGFLERFESTKLKFAHDKIFEAVSKLFSNQQEIQQLHYEVGFDIWVNMLGRRLDTSSTDLIFLCSHQFVKGRDYVIGHDLCQEVAGLHLLAARRAADLSAFLPALLHAKAAVSLLQPPKTFWSENYELALRANTLVVEYSCYTGKLPEHQESVDAVLAHSRSIRDSIRVRAAKIQCLIANAQFEEVLAATFSILEDLGEKITRNPSRVQTSTVMSGFRRRLKRLPGGLNGLFDIKTCEDWKKSVVTEFLYHGITSALQTGKHNLVAVLVSRMGILTLDFGQSAYSTLGLAIAAQLFVYEFMDIQFSIQLAKVALRLPMLDGKDFNRAGVMLYCYNNFHWQEPLATTTDCLLATYRVGMRNGDLQSAFQAIIVYCFTYFYSGLPLKPLLQDIERFNNILCEYGHSFFLLINVPVQQCVLNLTTEDSSEILDLYTGKAASYREKVGWAGRTGEQIQWAYQMQLAVYCDRLDVATAMFEKLEPASVGLMKSVAPYPTRIFFFAVISLWNLKETRKKKWKTAYLKHASLIRNWVVKHAALNLGHKLHILDAEISSLDKTLPVTDLCMAYNKAIRTSVKAGFLQDAALAAQLASRSIPHAKNDYFLKAMDFFKRWDAIGVCTYLSGQQRLEICSGNEDDQDGDDSKPTGYRATERFDAVVVTEHTTVERRPSLLVPGSSLKSLSGLSIRSSVRDVFGSDEYDSHNDSSGHH